MAYHRTWTTEAKVTLRSMIILCYFFRIGSEVLGYPVSTEWVAAQTLREEPSTGVQVVKGGHFDGK